MYFHIQALPKNYIGKLPVADEVALLPIKPKALAYIVHVYKNTKFLPVDILVIINSEDFINSNLIPDLE